MKKFFTLVAGLLLAIPVFGQVQSMVTNTENASSYLLLSATNGNIRSLQFIGGSVAQTVTLYDNDYNANVYTNSAYVVPTTYTTNVAVSYVTLGGATNWTTNAYIWTYNKSVAASTNASLPIRAVYYVPATTVVTVTEMPPSFTKGVLLVASATNKFTTILTYDNLR
jgi:hypothetical protein